MVQCSTALDAWLLCVHDVVKNVRVAFARYAIIAPQSGRMVNTSSAGNHALLTIRREIMTKEYEYKAQWIDVDPATLGEATREVYDKFRALIRAKAAAQVAFEDAMRADYAKLVKPEMRLVFGYRFGKLSTAIVPDAGEAKPKKEAKPVQSLEQYLAIQQAEGRAN